VQNRLSRAAVEPRAPRAARGQPALELESAEQKHDELGAQSAQTSALFE
jgi:hypothetical protein